MALDDILLRLILAHLAGDFFLQPAAWVRDKESRRFRSPKLYLHSLVHIALSCLLVARVDFIPYALLLGLLHCLIDLLKPYIAARQPIRAFVLDQILHFLSIWMIWALYSDDQVEIFWLFKQISWLHIIAYAFVTMPASILIKVCIAKWSPQTAPHESLGLNGLLNAGTWIGIMERLLVLTFIIQDQWGAIGFLIAAKSVFRFGDLREEKEVHLTEYILIGTLLSFGLAIATGLFVQYWDVAPAG